MNDDYDTKRKIKIFGIFQLLYDENVEFEYFNGFESIHLISSISDKNLLIRLIELGFSFDGENLVYSYNEK